MESEAVLGEPNNANEHADSVSVSAQAALTDDDEHEIVCRICRMPADADNPLYHPCKCSGSIRHVHSSCLSLWLERSKHDSCELCHHKFHFKPLFAENAPSRLPLSELFYGIGMKTATAARFACRVMLVLFVWFFLVPLATKVMWRLAFTRNMQQGWQAFTIWRGLKILADVVHGAFISLSLGCGLLLLSSAWDYFRQHAEVLGMAGAAAPGAPGGPPEGLAGDPLPRVPLPRPVEHWEDFERPPGADEEVSEGEEGDASSEDGFLRMRVVDARCWRGYPSDVNNGAQPPPLVCEEVVGEDDDSSSDMNGSELGEVQLQVPLTAAAGMLTGPGTSPGGHRGMVVRTSETEALFRAERDQRERGDPGDHPTGDNITIGLRPLRRARRRRAMLRASDSTPLGDRPLRASGPGGSFSFTRDAGVLGEPGAVPAPSAAAGRLPDSSTAAPPSSFSPGYLPTAAAFGGPDTSLPVSLSPLPSSSCGSAMSPTPALSSPSPTPRSSHASNLEEPFLGSSPHQASDLEDLFLGSSPDHASSLKQPLLGTAPARALALDLEEPFGGRAPDQASSRQEEPLGGCAPNQASSRLEEPLLGAAPIDEAFDWKGSALGSDLEGPSAASSIAGSSPPSLSSRGCTDGRSPLGPAGAAAPSSSGWGSLGPPTDAPYRISSSDQVSSGPSRWSSVQGRAEVLSASSGGSSVCTREQGAPVGRSPRPGPDTPRPDMAGPSGWNPYHGEAFFEVSEEDDVARSPRDRAGPSGGGLHRAAAFRFDADASHPSDSVPAVAPAAGDAPPADANFHNLPEDWRGLVAPQEPEQEGLGLRQRRPRWRRWVVRHGQGNQAARHHLAVAGPAFRAPGVAAPGALQAPPARIPPLDANGGALAAGDAVQQNPGPHTFEELAGLQGPMRHLGESLLTVLLMSFIFIFVALFIPFNLGRAAIAGLAQLQTVLAPEHPHPLLLTLLHDSALLPAAGNATGAPANASMPGPTPLSLSLLDTGGQASNETAAGPSPQMTHLAAWIGRIFEQLEVHFEGPDLADWVCLLVGYAIVAGLVLLGLWGFLTWKAQILFSGHWKRGLQRYGSMTALMRAVVVNVWEQFVSYVSYATLAAKVVLVLTLELLVLPAAHGFFIDVCMLPFLGGSIQGRLRLFAFSPITWIVVHWAIGMVFLMSVGSLLSLSRRLLRPGALPWLHDPYEGEQEQMRLLFQMPVVAHLEREAVAFGIMATVAVALVYVPVCVCTLLPGLLPLRFHLFDVHQVLDMLLFHIFLPFTLPYMRARETFCLAYAWWLRKASAFVGLEDYLLPPRPPQNPQPQLPPAHNRVPEANPVPQLAEPPARAAPGEIVPDGPQPVAGQEPQGTPVGTPRSPVGPSETSVGPTTIAGVAPIRRSVFGADGSVDDGLLYSRLTLLLLLLVLTLVALNVSVLVFPLMIGRLVMQLANIPAQNDLYGAAIGAYFIWGICAGLWHIVRLARLSNLQVGAFAAAVGGLLLNLLKLAVLGLTAFVILPCVVGDFSYKVFNPFMVHGMKETSLFSQLCQSWGLGIVFLKLSYLFTVGGFAVPGDPEQAVPIFMPDNAVRRRILALQARGWAHVPFVAAFRDCLGPLLLLFACLRVAPLLLTAGLLPLLPVPASITQGVDQYAYLGEVVLLTIVVAFLTLHSALSKLGKALHEERYVVGRQLTNLSDSES